MRWPGTDRSVVAKKTILWSWSEGIGSDSHRFETTGDRMTSSAVRDKPFKIDKREVGSYRSGQIQSRRGGSGQAGSWNSSRRTGSEIFTGSGIG